MCFDILSDYRGTEIPRTNSVAHRWLTFHREPLPLADLHSLHVRSYDSRTFNSFFPPDFPQQEQI